VENVPAPPPAPRDFRSGYILRKLLTDAWAIVAGVFFLLGSWFTLFSVVWTILSVDVFAGLLFAGLGMLFLAVTLPTLIWRYKNAQQTLNVLRMGEATLGSIVDVYEDFRVKVNNRNPWTTTYRFQVFDRDYEGKTTTLRTPGLRQQPGQPVYVLYLKDDPGQNTIYPPVM